MSLVKTVCGSVQSAQTVSEKMGFAQCPSDPCLLEKTSHGGDCCLTVHVDDDASVGPNQMLEWLVNETPKHGLAITVKGKLTDCFSCEVLFDKAKTKAWTGRPHVIKKIEKLFWEEVKNLQEHATPGATGQDLTQAKDDELKVDEDKHKRCRTGVGMLLCCIKHAGPGLCDPI